MESTMPIPYIDWSSFLSNPGCLVMMIPILAIVIGGITGLAKLIMRHRERMAMIECGIHPDYPADRQKQGPDNPGLMGRKEVI